jgi:hypothetical protein
MSKGGPAPDGARRHRDYAAELTQRSRQAHAAAEHWTGASRIERAMLASLLSLTAIGWRVLVDRDWPNQRVAGYPTADLILVGPGGLIVIDIKHVQPSEVDQAHLLAATRRVEDVIAVLQISPVAVIPAMVFAEQNRKERAGRVFHYGIKQLMEQATAARTRLQPTLVAVVVDQLAKSMPNYDAPQLRDLQVGDHQHPGGLADEAEDSALPLTLFDAEALAEAQHRAILAKPVETWMTFLHPDQLAMVRRRWDGPARISGPAGTGKTVVGLHRAAYLARLTSRRILYVTFVRNLPLVQQHLLQQMAPDLGGRVEFSSLHGWANNLLEQRGITLRLNRARVDDCFAWAWLNFGRTSCLAALEGSPQYWQEEIDHVIKGRGLTELAEYLGVTRLGRRTPLQPAHRRAMWELFQVYQRRMAEREVHDFADLLLAALAQLRRQPLDNGYAAVIADEVQDLTLTGVRILHELVGDRPNGLLLIGDGQQAVYPGGFRLADADISIRGGRAEVLKVNYRNAAQILDRALAVIDGDPFDDIDGITITEGPVVERVYHDGQVVHAVAGNDQELDRALLAALSDLVTPSSAGAATTALADAAVLCASKRDAQAYERILRRAGFPVLNLDEYDGRPAGALKVGTYLRSKGLEFKSVFLPHYDRGLRVAELGGEADIDRLTLARRRLYVGMTRARDLLWLGSVTGR